MKQGLSLEEATRLNSIEYRESLFLADPVRNLAPSMFPRELVPIMESGFVHFKGVGFVWQENHLTGRYENPLHATDLGIEVEG